MWTQVRKELLQWLQMSLGLGPQQALSQQYIISASLSFQHNSRGGGLQLMLASIQYCSKLKCILGIIKMTWNALITAWFLMYFPFNLVFKSFLVEVDDSLQPLRYY